MEGRETLLTPQQVASILQVSVGMVLRLLRSSRLRGVKLGRHWRVRTSDLEAYLDSSIVKQSCSIPTEDASVLVNPVAPSQPRAFSLSSRIATLGVIVLLLAQVALLSALVVMASTWGSTPGVGYEPKLTGSSASLPDTRAIGTGSGILLPNPNSSGIGTGIAGESNTKNPGQPTPLPSPSATSPNSTPQASESTRSQPASLIVGNTGGEGVNIRLTPGNGDRLKAWPEGTIMVVIGDDQYAEGRMWKNVRDPEGQKGWVAADYLIYPPTPTAPPVSDTTNGAPGIELELLTSNSYNQYNLTVVEGQVRNLSGKSLSNVEAIVQWYSLTNEFIKSESNLIAYDPILQNQVSPFKVITTYNPAMARFTVNFKSQDGGEIPMLDSRKRPERKD